MADMFPLQSYNLRKQTFSALGFAMFN